MCVRSAQRWDESARYGRIYYYHRRVDNRIWNIFCGRDQSMVIINLLYHRCVCTHNYNSRQLVKRLRGHFYAIDVYYYNVRRWEGVEVFAIVDNL